MSIFTKSGHLGRETLGLHVLADLPIYEQHDADAHLANCRSCRELRAEVKLVLNALRAPVSAQVPAVRY